MTRMKFTLGSAALVLAAMLFQVGAADDASPQPGSATSQPAKKAPRIGSPLEANSGAPDNQQGKDTDRAGQNADELEADLPDADKEALFSTAETFVNAYNKGDAKAIAALFSPNAEYLDEQGFRFRGRAAIERAFTACLSTLKGAQIEMTIHSIRLVAPTVVIEDGTTTVTSDELTEGQIETHYSATHVKTDGKWQTVSVRESSPKGQREHKAQLQQLSWLLGEWVNEGEDTLAMSSCKPIQGGNFLLREFTLRIGGEEIINGEQRIGWDPLTGGLKSWTFDSDGGYSEGFWQRDDNRWVLKSVGVSTDGQPASCTTIYTVVDQDTMQWQTVDHQVAGDTLRDSDVITVVRRAPTPKAEGEHLTYERR